jgi:hypothetical protein
MAIPATAKRLGKTLDPSDIKPIMIDFSPAIPAGAGIDSYTMTISPEGVTLGMEIMSGDGRDPSLENDDTAIKFWPAIAEDEAQNPIFDGAGVAVALEVTIIMTTVPAQVDQQTFLIPWAQK